MAVGAERGTTTIVERPIAGAVAVPAIQPESESPLATFFWEKKLTAAGNDRLLDNPTLV